MEKNKSYIDSESPLKVSLFMAPSEESGLHCLAVRAAGYILNSSKNAIKSMIKIAKEHPSILRLSITAKDDLGRVIKGTLLQIAAMAGDFDLYGNTQREEQRGVVELLAAIPGGLSKYEIVTQLDQVIRSAKATQANQKRVDAIHRVISLILWYFKKPANGLGKRVLNF